MATKAGTKRTPNAVTDIAPHFDITIEGFKSISRRQTLSFRGLTILAGSNSSGKSSFMQPLLMLKQTLEAPYDPGALLINGPHVKFTSTHQFLSEGRGLTRANEFVVGFKNNYGDTSIRFRKPEDKPIELADQTFVLQRKSFAIHLGDEFASPFKELPVELRKHIGMFFPPGFKNARAEVVRDRCFLNIAIYSNVGKNRYQIPLAPRISGDFPKILRSMIHLPGLRGNPERTYPISAIGKTYPGPFQSYAASIIDSWQEKSSPPLATLNQYLSELNLASKIVTRKVDETQVELRVNRIANQDASYVSIADVGMAVSQVLPVLVALASAEHGQLVFIEQPELHLHPRAQVALARILCAAVERGINLVLETHSSLLLLGIQTCVAENIIDSKDVALHWFTRDSDGITCVESSKLDTDGSFGDWPEDFGDVSLEAEDTYLSAVEKTRRKEGAIA